VSDGPEPWIDTHCHLASAKFGGEGGQVVARALEQGLAGMVTLATCFDDFDANAALAAAHEKVWCCLGVHPCDVDSLEDTGADWPQRLADRARGVASAIGESGLDYYHAPPEGWSEERWKSAQIESLRRHFEIAETLGLGIVLHTRDRSGRQSLADALEVARDFKSRVRPLFHCYSGPADWLERIAELDGMVSFGGVLTFPSAGETREAAAAVPESMLLVETDAPYLAPVPYRGQCNEPAFVVHTGRALAALRGVDAAVLARATTRNAREFFRMGGV